MQLRPYLDDLVALFYPKICPGCAMPMQRSEQHMCLYCTFRLPKTGFESGRDNPVEKIFKGRIPVSQANSFLYFKKQGMAQRLMHELKYNGNKDLGFYLGELFATELMADPGFRKPDVLATVPLHPQKMLKRGFNQSDEIAKGFSSSSGIPIANGLLKRSKNTGTQTRKKRFERWENTEDSFALNDTQMLKGKHIGLIDDVITTGATLESCASKLQQAGDTRISIFSLCITIH
jgi:ComF family protein